jgi:acyl-CoA thioesterase I
VAAHDVRVVFIGDSLVAGVGDPDYLGWVGRLAQRTHRKGQPVTVYNLGIRMDTSADVLARLAAEAQRRSLSDVDMCVVVSVGVNDCAFNGDVRRIAAEDSVANLSEIIQVAEQVRIRPFVVGPPPVADSAHNVRIADLDERFAETCRRVGVSYAAVYEPLTASEIWMTEVRTGDGAHPGGDGYQALADLVFAPWWEWLHNSHYASPLTTD